MGSPPAPTTLLLSPMVLQFILKKFVAYWLTPQSVFFVLAAVGLWLVRSERRRKLGYGTLVAATLFLYLASNAWVGDALIRPLERTYPPIPEITAGSPVPTALANCRYVVVLGGGNGHTEGMAGVSELSTASLARLVEGVRILRVLPEAKLLVSGSKPQKYDSHAQVLARAAVSLGIERSRIVLNEQALDTEDEARQVRERVGQESVALVTSAWHMPRAMALFRRQGLNPVAAPTDFRTHDDIETAGGTVAIPLAWGIEALNNTHWAIRERIGFLWVKLRGKA